ncbi:MFS transporter [Bradyrhizobium sp. WSM 1704]|uniref:MFS transporter n=1 Tax=Bradyrhizobium semiaridum TaxID=2821404 RepID=UPI001CE26D6E|nr:MFS transporter [Bradyrhizobium semiaridum]MCA6122959.1 MFS transporter [Bradyrhizobium semiaridum]
MTTAGRARFLGLDREVAGVLLVLAITQLIGWGSLGLPAIVGNAIAADLHIALPAVFAGTSTLYVVMGLCGPLLAEPFRRLGARRVMIAGTLASVLGFILLACAHEAALYFVAWTILGIAGSASLSTAAYIMLNEVAGRNAKGAIGALMLITGLSSSMFWPTTAFLAHAIGWRGTCLVYAAAMLLVCLPLYTFGLPRRSVAESQTSPVGRASAPPAVHRSTFVLVVAAIALNAFVSFGFSAVLVELLKAQGLSAMEAVAFGSMLGVVQVSARAINFLGGGRWDGITTGLVAGALLPVAMLILIAGGGATWAIAAFILIYGLGSGALAVARATIPLVFYDKDAFAKASSQIALPLNLISAAAPPTLAALLTRFGSNAVLELAFACSIGALVMLAILGRRRAVHVVASSP